MNNSKKYWNSLEQLNGDTAFVEASQKEFSEQVPVDEFIGKQTDESGNSSRRDFLKFLGFSITAATLAACEAPIVKSIPYVVKPEEITPGVANYYSSSFYDGNDYCSVLVKTREGRPILIEGNKLSPITKGRITARVNSSVLSLYDSKRYNAPQADGNDSNWSDIDGQISDKLKSIAASGGQVRVLSSTIASPSTQKAINEFGAQFVNEEVSNFKHVSYDAISHSGMLEANLRDFGESIIPDYDFTKANSIVSIDADFLNSWLIASANLNDYSIGRKPANGKMSKHFQFEANLSMTGSNADVRGAVKPSELGVVATELYNAVASKVGQSKISSGSIEDDNNIASKINEAAASLIANKGASMVVCGVNDVNIQTIVNGINQMLNNYGNTINLDSALKVRSGIDGEVASLISEMAAGQVDALFVYGVDPSYTLPAVLGFNVALEKVGMKVSLSGKPNATSGLCDFVCPDSHYLESWNDINPKVGHYSIQQPTIKTIFNTRQAQQSLLKWTGVELDYYDFVKANWETSIFALQTKYSYFNEFWNTVVHDGVFIADKKKSWEWAYANNASTAAQNIKVIASGDFELALYASNAIGDGAQSDNPWLQELPDPVSKVVWDNYIMMNPADMEGLYEIRTAQEVPADLATLESNGQTITLPVVAIPGQRVGTVGVAIGYGNSMVDGRSVGANAYSLTNFTNNSIGFNVSGVTVTKTGEKYPIASTQTHHTMMGRKIVNETDIETFNKGDKENYNATILLKDAFGLDKTTAELDLWNEHPIAKGHRWGLSVDLNACTGCGACVTACNAENNVPVVGKDEVRRTRTMSWMRIDRYYSSDYDPKRKDGEKSYNEMEVPSKYPEVVHQPLMCQHCNHAPCETVCPVAATTHSNEGLNQMTYNRCVGTRYCANNCPFKVRRFNWFNYVGDEKFADFNPSQDSVMRMVLNPDVTVRSRGVMEKCSMCVQRIQAGKLEAKKNSEPVQNQAIQTACSSACNENAIVFGDINDDKHTIASLAKDDRAYNMLEEVGVKPNIYYQTKVRNIATPEYNSNTEQSA